ncbi:magnesium transporter [Rhizobiaceae bacterium]|nr:magnesium transporter [Rhizobiaceae bacterium]
MSMNEDHDTAPVETEEHPSIYGPTGAVREAIVDAAEEAVDAGDDVAVRNVIRDMHESEVGDLLEAMDEEDRASFVQLAGEEFDYSALTEVDEAIRTDILDQLDGDRVAEGVRELDSDDAVYLLEDMEPDEREAILAKMPFKERLRLRRALDYGEETAGRRMQTEFIAVPPFWTVGQAIDYIRADDDLPDRFSQIFTVDPTFKLVGTLPLDTLIRARRRVLVSDIHETNAHPIAAELDQEEAARVFEQYDLLSAPVVDANERLVGVLTIDDVVDVIQEEAAEDIRRLAGVGDEELSDSVMDIARSRIGWLTINLATSILASLIIGMFDATIGQMVALAVLMPIVASMGGNAGTQTMTVAVRALSAHELDSYNTRKIVKKELIVGALNGVVFAVMMGVVAAVWFSEPQLGLVIGIAMIINMIFAAGSGILIPITLNKFGADPAIASGVFVTTVTDVVGFFAFLGLAAWWFGI